MAMIEALSPEKRLQILSGAARVFAADGYEGASMSRIACEANVSKGTLYNHFDSKAALFGAWVELECQQKLSHVFGTIGDDGAPEVVLREVARRMIELMVSPLGTTMYRVVVAEVGKFPELAEAFYEAGPARAIRQLSVWLARATERGELATRDPDFAAEQFMALCQTRIGMRQKLGIAVDLSEAGIERVVDCTVRMFLRSYGVGQ